MAQSYDRGSEEIEDETEEFEKELREEEDEVRDPTFIWPKVGSRWIRLTNHHFLRGSVPYSGVFPSFLTDEHET